MTSSQRCLRLGSLPRLDDQRQLALAADEARLVRSLRRLADSDEAVRRDRLGLAFQRLVGRAARLEPSGEEVKRRLPDKDLVRLGRLLEPRGDVDCVTGRETLLGAGDHLTRVHADSALHDQVCERRCASRLPPDRPEVRRPRAAAGTPKTATTASPMNFSTEPRCDSTISLIRSK